MKLRATLLLVVSTCALSGSVSAGNPRHDRAFWQAIVASEYAVPQGESASALVNELGDLFASPDPELRDGFGYTISAQWVTTGKLSADDLRALVTRWSANLKKGVGETGTDGIFLRSFSALGLSLLAAVDNDPEKGGFLSPEAHHQLLDDALAYLAAEKDVRGYDPKVGWMHSTAHTADLLKFLARSPKLRVADQARIAAAIEKKLGSVSAVYAFGEDERLGRALLSLTRRKDLDPKPLLEWPARLQAAHKEMWSAPTLDPARFVGVQNQKNVLKSLYVLLSSESPELREKLLASLSRCM